MQMFSVLMQLSMFLQSFSIHCEEQQEFLDLNLPQMQKSAFASDAGRVCWGKLPIWVAEASLAALSHAPPLECRRRVVCCQMRLIIVFALDRARSLTNLQVENNMNEDKSWNGTFFSPTMKTNSQFQFPKHVIFIKLYCRFFCSEFIFGAHVHDLESSRVAISHFYIRIQIMSHKILF